MKTCPKCKNNYDNIIYTKACSYCGLSNTRQAVLGRALRYAKEEKNYEK